MVTHTSSKKIPVDKTREESTLMLKNFCSNLRFADDVAFTTLTAVMEVSRPGLVSRPILRPAFAGLGLGPGNLGLGLVL